MLAVVTRGIEALIDTFIYMTWQERVVFWGFCGMALMALTVLGLLII